MPYMIAVSLEMSDEPLLFYCSLSLSNTYLNFNKMQYLCM